jgi:hypothetical protein
MAAFAKSWRGNGKCYGLFVPDVPVRNIHRAAAHNR